MSTRSYACNLMFRDRSNPIVDSENNNWKLSMKDNGAIFTNPSLMGIYNKGFTTMKISKVGNYVYNTKPLDLRKNWQYSISLRYSIDKDWLDLMIKDQLRVPGMQWDDGEIMLYDHANGFDGMCFSMTMGKVRIEFPIEYDQLGINQPVHLLIGMHRMNVVVLINGVLHARQFHEEPTYVFRNMKLGNFLEDEAGRVEFDELCMVDDFVYTKDFKTPIKPFHMLYPETTIEDEDYNRHIGVATNGLIRVNDSNQDHIGKLDIVRHVDYEPPLAYRTERKRKYEHQYEGLDDDVASYYDGLKRRYRDGI